MLNRVNRVNTQVRVDRQVWWYEQKLLSYTCFYDTFKHLNCWYLCADITFTPDVLPIMAKYDLYVILWPMYSFIAHRNGVCLSCYLVIVTVRGDRCPSGGQADSCSITLVTLQCTRPAAAWMCRRRTASLVWIHLFRLMELNLPTDPLQNNTTQIRTAVMGPRRFSSSWIMPTKPWSNVIYLLAMMVTAHLQAPCVWTLI